MKIDNDLIYKWGIYKIYNNKNRKIYIGSSNNLRKRLTEHFMMLKKNQHKNPILQNAYNKYGEESFSYEILELYQYNKDISLKENKKELLKLEQSYLDRYQPFNKNGYNIMLEASGGKRVGRLQKKFLKNEEKIKQMASEGKSCTDIANFLKEDVENTRELLKRNNINFKKIRGKIEIYKFSFLGEFICKYSSIVEAAQSENLTEMSVKSCCEGKRKTAGNCRWSYTNSCIMPTKIEIILGESDHKKFFPVIKYQNNIPIKMYKSALTAANLDRNLAKHIRNICKRQEVSEDSVYWKFAREVPEKDLDCLIKNNNNNLMK